jgi:hypothetical protein
MMEDVWVGGFVSRGGRWSAITPNRHGVRRCAATQQLQAEAFLALWGLLGKPAIKPDALFPALDCCGGKALPGLPCQVSTNGVSLIPILELMGNSVDTHGFASANSGFLDMASTKRCSLHSKARYRVGKKGWAKLGDGIVASVVAGKGAIDPTGIPPMVWCGWEG